MMQTRELGLKHCESKGYYNPCANRYFRRKTLREIASERTFFPSLKVQILSFLIFSYLCV